MTGTVRGGGADVPAASGNVAGDRERTVVRPGLFHCESPGALTPGERARLAASRCGHCGRVEFPARERCPACANDARRIGLSPDARLGAFTTVLHPVPGARIQPPYHVGIAQFTEGIAVMGILLAGEDDDLRAGQSIETVAFEPSDGAITYAFRPRR